MKKNKPFCEKSNVFLIKINEFFEKANDFMRKKPKDFLKSSDFFGKYHAILNITVVSKNFEISEKIQLIP